MAKFVGTEDSDFFNRMILGDDTADDLQGLGGNDWLDGGSEADLINGGEGFDMVRYDLDATGVEVNLKTGVAIDGDGFTDTLESIEAVAGSNFDDFIRGNQIGNDLIAGAGNDTLYGAEGDDDFWPVSGNNWIYGGSGDRDRIWYDRSVALKLNLETGLVTLADDTVDWLRGIEDVVGSEYDDVLIGSELANSFIGGGGDDTIRSGKKADTLDGGEGNDVLDAGRGRDLIYAGLGKDQIKGGKGKDLLMLDDATFLDVESIKIDLEEGRMTVTDDGLETVSKVVGIENISITGEMGLRLTGSDKANKFIGADGMDTLKGGAGKDTLDGGSGDDLLTGGEDADVFVFEGNYGSDVVTDFDVTLKAEKIRIDSNGEAQSLEEFLAASRQVGDDVVYDAFQDGQSTITLRHVILEDLTASSFDFG